MMETNREKSALDISSQIVLLQDKSQQNGDRFLKFSLNQQVNTLLPLGKLQAVINVKIEDILPVPQVKEFWLGIINWRGQAIWILDLASLIGANHWCRGTEIKDAGMAILVKIEDRIIGFLVEKVSTIATLDSSKQLSLSESMLPENWAAFFSGYFLDPDNNPLMLIDLEVVYKEAFE